MTDPIIWKEESEMDILILAIMIIRVILIIQIIQNRK